MTIDDIIDEVIKAERGYVNDPTDKGGETNFGITVAVARANNYTGSMRDMPLAVARSIYLQRYVNEPKFDRVVAIDGRIGAELVDTGVNMGPHRSAEFLQRWLNAFNDTGSRYQDLFVDGRLGDISFAALSAYIKWRGKEGIDVMLCALNSIQGARYLEIVEGDRSQRRFAYGWVRNRVVI
jgi:lysozyme family protein